ncbi:MAG: hypothetical protein HGA41_03720, partial [Syntrophaceae bacterium]|nr:hypothetical protein [Syntrophaceae bacterium]
MNEIKVTLPDDSISMHAPGKKVDEIVASWNKEALVSTVAVRLNGALVDLSHSVGEEATISL